MSARRLRWRAAGGGALVAVVLAAAAYGASHARDGDRFAVFCGVAAAGQARLQDYADGRDPDQYRPCICGGDAREPAERSLLGRVADALRPEEPERPTGACLTAERRDNIETWAVEAFQDLTAYGFASPSPNRLGPVMTDHEGLPAVRLYANPDYQGYAQTEMPCSARTRRYVDLLSRVTFSVGQFGRLRPEASDTFEDPFVYRMLAHELFHVIQNAQTFERLHSGDCPAPLWVRESAADALSVELLSRRFPSFRPPLAVKGSRSVYGLRPYNRAFTWVDRTVNDRWGNALVPDYTLSSFWTYLAERFSGGDFRYLARLYAAQGGGSDWLGWLDERLQAVIGHPLYVIFPDFVAHYARWGVERFPDIGERTWLAESFGAGSGLENGCEPVELSPTGSVKAHVILDFEPISARCVRVRVQGLEPGQRAWVKFMTYDTSSERLDNLHLAIAYSTGVAVESGGTLDCYRNPRGASSSRPCLVKAFVGEKRTGTGEAGLLARTWLSDQYETQGGGMEILYLLSHAPVNPTDGQHDRAAVVQTADFTVALQTTSLVTSAEGSSPRASAAVNDVPETGTVPMSGVDAGAAGLFASALLRPGSAFPGLELPSGAPVGDGIRTLTLRDSLGAQPGSGLEIRLQLLERPLTLGGEGVYRAYVTGTSGGAGGDGGGLPSAMFRLPTGAAAGLSGMLVNVPVNDRAGSAAIQVLEFSDDLLHLRVEGSYCRGQNLDVQTGACRAPETFRANVLRPFGWTYDVEQEFGSIDTPGMVEYRKYLPYGRTVLTAIPGVPVPGGPTSTRAGGSGAGGGAGGELQTAPQGSLVLGGESYVLTTNLCDLPDRIPGIVLSAEARGQDGSQGMVMVGENERPGGLLEQTVTVTLPGGSHVATHRRRGTWELLRPTPARNPSSSLDRGPPEWVPADGPLLRIEGSTLHATARFYAITTSVAGLGGTLQVTCPAGGGPGSRN